MQTFNSSQVTLTRHRYSVTQGEVSVSYAGEKLGQFHDPIYLTPKGTHEGAADPHWIGIAQDCMEPRFIAAAAGRLRADEVWAQGSWRDAPGRCPTYLALAASDRGRWQVGAIFKAWTDAYRARYLEHQAASQRPAQLPERKRAMPSRLALAAICCLATTHAALANQTVWQCNLVYDEIRRPSHHTVVIDASRGMVTDNGTWFVNGGKNLWSDEYERFADIKPASSNPMSWGTRPKNGGTDAIKYTLDPTDGSYAINSRGKLFGHGVCKRDDGGELTD